MLMYVVREPSVPKRDRDGKLILSYPILSCNCSMFRKVMERALPVDAVEATVLQDLGLDKYIEENASVSGVEKRDNQ